MKLLYHSLIVVLGILPPISTLPALAQSRDISKLEVSPLSGKVLGEEVEMLGGDDGVYEEFPESFLSKILQTPDNPEISKITLNSDNTGKSHPTLAHPTDTGKITENFDNDGKSYPTSAHPTDTGKITENFDNDGKFYLTLSHPTETGKITVTSDNDGKSYLTLADKTERWKISGNFDNNGKYYPTLAHPTETGKISGNFDKDGKYYPISAQPTDTGKISGNFDNDGKSYLTLSHPTDTGKISGNFDTDKTENSETPTSPDSPDTETQPNQNGENPTPPSSETSTDTQPQLTPEELARQEKLIEADRLYKNGDIAAAQKLYREVKAPFAETTENSLPTAIYDPTQLSPAAAVYWRQAQSGLAQNLETKILIPLKFLVQEQPEFIPAQVEYAQSLKNYGKQEEALEVLEKATTLYPNEPDLIKAKITALNDAEKWLEASLAARQFALLNPTHPQAKEFETIADEYLERYKSHLRSEMRGNAIANIITGALGYIFTGNIFGPISAIDTTVLLLRGESAVGEKLSERVQKQLPMLEDEEVLAYVREVGNKLAAVAGRKEFDYQFYVVMDDQINAFALPGGKVFINAGAILKTKSEAELAGLIGHELSHAVLSHGFQLVTEGNLIANITQYIPFGGTAANLIVLNYSRDMERQADDLGTKILVGGGYAADGLHNLMITMSEEEKERPLFAWLSTHPDTKERIENLETLIDSNGYNRYAYEGVERHLAIQKRVRQLLQNYQESQKKEEEEEEEEE